MLVWNYRLVHHVNDGHHTYTLHEVFYDENDKIEGWTENAIAPRGDDAIEAHMDWTMMGEAFIKKPLDISEDGKKLIEPD